jgi:MFS transporter, DHA1 family, multidrug resistance protein
VDYFSPSGNLVQKRTLLLLSHRTRMTDSQHIPVRRSRWILPLLGALCVVTPFAIDMYLPAFGAIAAEFHTTTSAISLSLSTYFIGFAIGQMLYGPLLDRYGRKRPIYAGLAVYVFFSVGCLAATDLKTLVTFRFFEALGGCVAQVGAIAMVRDFYPVKDSAKVFSLLFLMIGVSPLLAPTIGSAFVATLGWRYIFGLLAVIALTILALITFFLPEGHQPDHSVSLRPAPILAGFWTILRNPQFLVFALAGSFSFAGLFGFVAGSPLIFMDGFHMSAKTFGLIFAVLVMGFIGGNQVNVILLRRFCSRQIFVAALILQVATGLVFYAGSLAHILLLPTILALFFVFLSCIGLTYPNAAAIGLAPFSRDAGRASALIGFFQTGTGSLISTCVGALGARSVNPLLAFTPLVALALYLAGKSFIQAPVEVHGEEAVTLH